MTLLMMAATALAADNEIALELGSLYTDDSAWDAFSSNDVLPARGIRGAFGVAEDVSVIASYGFSARGADVDVWGSNDDDWLKTAFYGHTLGVGAKYNLLDWTYLRPYVAPQALALYGIARLDDDPDDDNSLNQLQASGFSFGGMVNGGVDLVLADDRWGFAPALYGELGYGWMSQLELDQYGDVQFKGLSARFGVGVHF